ncbi:MAG: hypothetical protein LBP19_05315 [Treponema sp.]|jgi:hypothetical protein|nr:hypothetical protein [Treponema sp.]
MAQANSMARKIRVYLDGTDELQGLTSFGDVNLENGMIDVPTFDRILKIHNGVTTMPQVDLTFETRRSTTTREILRAWFNDKEAHDLIIDQLDATGTSFEKISWTGVECAALKEPAADTSSPTYAQLTVTLIPYDIQVVE